MSGESIGVDVQRIRDGPRKVADSELVGRTAEFGETMSDSAS